MVEQEQRRIRYLASGCLRPKTGLPFEDRLVFLYDGLTELIQSWRPEQAAVETTFFGKDPTAAARLGEARGVLVLAAAKAGLAIAHYAPAAVKKSVVGRGRATKEQVRYMIAKMLGLREPPEPHDASDALALALCHLARSAVAVPASTHRPRPEVEALLKRARRR